MFRCIAFELGGALCTMTSHPRPLAEALHHMVLLRDEQATKDATENASMEFHEKEYQRMKACEIEIRAQREEEGVLSIPMQHEIWAPALDGLNPISSLSGPVNDKYKQSLFTQHTPPVERDDLMCMICARVPDKKYLLPCRKGAGLERSEKASLDRHSFCTECIQKMTKPSEVPTSSSTLTCCYCFCKCEDFEKEMVLYEDSVHEELLENARVDCNGSRCPWVGTFRAHEAHINECKRVLVKCNVCTSSTGADVTVSRAEMNLHLTSAKEPHFTLLEAFHIQKVVAAINKYEKQQKLIADEIKAAYDELPDKIEFLSGIVHKEYQYAERQWNRWNAIKQDKEMEAQAAKAKLESEIEGMEYATEELISLVYGDRDRLNQELELNKYNLLVETQNTLIGTHKQHEFESKLHFFYLFKRYVVRTLKAYYETCTAIDECEVLIQSSNAESGLSLIIQCMDRALDEIFDL
eukprot:757044-Rhodomonas_salina.1